MSGRRAHGAGRIERFEGRGWRDRGKKLAMGFSWLLAGPALRAQLADVPTALSMRRRFDGKMMRSEERYGVRGAIFGLNAHFH